MIFAETRSIADNRHKYTIFCLCQNLALMTKIQHFCARIGHQPIFDGEGRGDGFSQSARHNNQCLFLPLAHHLCDIADARYLVLARRSDQFLLAHSSSSGLSLVDYLNLKGLLISTIKYMLCQIIGGGKKTALLYVGAAFSYSLRAFLFDNLVDNAGEVMNRDRCDYQWR